MVAAVPNANKQKFIEHAGNFARLAKQHGALKVMENWGDDVPDGELTSLPMAVKKEADETVVFSWIVWPSRKAHEEGWAKIMADESMKEMAMPFDGKRLIFGRFETVLEA
jgi:uncharacterized protein YbaA (DUF1428 family)